MRELFTVAPRPGRRMSNTLFDRIEQSRVYDWTMRLPIVLYSLYTLVHDVTNFAKQFAQDSASWVHADAGVIIATLARVSQWMFIALMAMLPLFRHRPIVKSTAWLPRMAALLLRETRRISVKLPSRPARRLRERFRL